MSGDLEQEVASVEARQVVAVLIKAAQRVIERGWIPTRIYQPAGPVTALEAITKACAELYGPGVQSVAMHMACLDAVCAEVFGPGSRCGLNGVSVSRWERQADQSEENIVATLQGID